MRAAVGDQPRIQALDEHLADSFSEHFQRHRAESGRGERHFMPYGPEDPLGPTAPDLWRLNLTVDTPGWQRWFVATLDGADEHPRTVGHVDLKGDTISTGMHRCELGIGIERSYRGHGLGRRLMLHATEFARATGTIEWVDLKVFAHNAPARALYRALGFQEVGTVTDRFRIADASIDDVLMTLRVVR